MRKRFRNFVKFCSDKTCFIVALNIVFLIVFIFSFYNVARNRALSVLIDQVYHKEELAVSSGVESIQVFLEIAGNSLLPLSRDPSVINQDASIQENLDNFILEWTGTPVLAVIRSDKNGELSFMSNNVDIGQSSELVKGLFINNRDYFNWAKTANEGEVFLGKPQLARIKMAKMPDFSFFLPLATPIHQSGEFDGVLILAISLSELTMTYLEPIEVSPDYRVYLLHSDGTILVGPSEQLGLVKLNYFEYLRDNPYPGSEKAAEDLAKALAAQEKGRLDVVFSSPIEKGPTRFLIAYSPLFFNDDHWTLGIAVPFDDVQKAFDPLRETSIFLLSTVVLFTLIVSIMSVYFVKVNHGKNYIQNQEEGEKVENENVK